MGLKLDVNGLMNEYMNNVYIELEFALESWEQEVDSHIMSNFIKEHGNPEVETEIKRESDKLIAFFKANPAVLADTYGTGSLMNIQDNPDFQEYRNSSYWNKARNGLAIVGRPEGEYTDIFGRTKYSSGYLEGRNIEYSESITGMTYEPIPPSNAIQIANEWFYGTYFPQACTNAFKKTNFSKYVKEVK